MLILETLVREIGGLAQGLLPRRDQGIQSTQAKHVDRTAGGGSERGWWSRWSSVAFRRKLGLKGCLHDRGQATDFNQR